jgi:hypothetical protein
MSAGINRVKVSLNGTVANQSALNWASNDMISSGESINVNGYGNIINEDEYKVHV